ncbi:GFA family protein [Methylovirgula sp. 4M-Z18]|uniref:GFA family protein n=1 Tax=Methylovirgula sp. 4M-Z18 TaxID=2293567 RepID=UPI000E2F4643|nr:GFA family protein [Methylovirgula sp. 4M-Z18]RFB79726.1 aldehyde-activating protein [Methylovirgula sp. 4M-Z18]
MNVTGGCLCKAVRFEIAAAPITARTCWCRLCQYVGAGSATVNVVFPKSAAKVTGSSAVYRCIADSGAHMNRSFCATCGTHLFSEAEERPHLLIVRAGTLDDPEIGKPEMTIWTKTAPSWACFDPALPQHEGPAPPAK